MKTTRPFDTTWYVEQEKRIREADALARATRQAPDSGYVYIVEFVSGVIKVGKAVNPKSRLAQHATYARIHGGDVRRTWVSERHRGYDDTERLLIEGCRKIGERISREHFRGVSFPAIRDYAKLAVLQVSAA